MLTTFRMMPRFFFYLFNEATKMAYALVMMAMSRDTHTLTLRLVCIMKNIFFFWENRLVFLCSFVILKIS